MLTRTDSELIASRTAFEESVIDEAFRVLADNVQAARGLKLPGDDRAAVLEAAMIRYLRSADR